ncbi:hypothetical protein FCM35_KLT05924 [Carex littledalei]|uniref:Uncharacterized protein n=1 Tax=Carex littledalei TaxID=544730 RepID=A0A833QWD2_9POAL|nr:hypothetical protein FCM35_KLT05924 [Carex littledalei]
MQPFSRHARFFSSLDQVENRLAFEKKQKLSPLVELTPKSEFKESNFSPSQSDSLGSPLYLANPNPNPAGPNNSGPALDFLSDTETPQEEEQALEEKDGDEINLVQDCGEERDIEKLIKLLCLSGGGNKLRCQKERKLDEWIEYYYKIWRDGERREQTRLTYLLLSKASYNNGNFEFPKAMDEFLEVAPPST